jgi:hypothetical protein
LGVTVGKEDAGVANGPMGIPRSADFVGPSVRGMVRRS